MKKYVDFKLIEKKPKTQVYGVYSRQHGDFLGRIYWFFGWRQYVFEPTPKSIWSCGCLQQVIEFIEKLMLERKK